MENTYFNVEFPNKIGNYDKLPVRFDFDREEIDLKRDFDNVKIGALEECLISYDNHIHRVILRINGRGEEMRLVGQKMELFYDHIGPLSATLEIETTFDGLDLELVLKQFKEWLKEVI